MITQKTPKPTAAEERDAYELATIRDDDTCQRCRRDCGPTARDHRKNRSQGGLTTVDNLQILGLACHQWATEHPRDAEREGWNVPGYVNNPGEWPARRWLPSEHNIWTLAWVLYRADGRWLEINEDEAEFRMRSVL